MPPKTLQFNEKISGVLQWADKIPPPPPILPLTREFFTEFIWDTKREIQKVVAYESGRSKRVDCMIFIQRHYCSK